MADHLSSDHLSTLNAAADAVVDTLANNNHWGPSGTKPGQYSFDLLADKAAISILTDAGLGVLSEETGLQGTTDAVAVLDPVDGSTNASRRFRYFATSICVVQNNELISALVHHHGTGDRYEAVRGNGAKLNGSTIPTTTSRALSDAIIGHNGVPSQRGPWAQSRMFGAAALEMCAVADGRLDGFVNYSLNGLASWDYLGAMLICGECGVEVRDARGEELVTLDFEARRSPVAAPAPLIDELMTLASL